MIVKDDISEYKTKTMHQLLDDENVLELIDEPDIVKEDPYELIYKNVFPFRRIPKEDTQEEVKAFILIAVDVPSISRINKLIKNMSLSITVLCHTGKMKTSYGGTRVDLLSAAIQNVLNKNKEFNGRKLEYVNDVEGFLQGGSYFYREMRFQTEDINSGMC